MLKDRAISVVKVSDTDFAKQVTNTVDVESGTLMILRTSETAGAN